MGTNYYWYSDPCPTCQHSQEELHIGKSSMGWAFNLRVHPDKGIETLDHWRKKWVTGYIKNEYGEVQTPDEMLQCITLRSHPDGLLYASDEPDLNRHGRRCWRGEGAYCYSDYEFS